MPNLLSRKATPSFIRDPDSHVHVCTQDEVADKIASILPALLLAEGYLLMELPNIEPDGYGGWSVHVPLSERPWAGGEIRIAHTGHVLLAGVPPRLPLADAPTVAGALLAIHTAGTNLHNRR